MLVMSKPDPAETARALVIERFPSARQAWLAGSVVRGEATETSDLDIPVLLDEADPHRETLTYRGWLVEVFVHTEESIRRFLAHDMARRRPTLARMVSTGVRLLPLDGGAEIIRSECADLLARGPEPLTDLDLAHARYALTDLLDDLAGGALPPVLDAIIIDIWRGCLELVLARAGRWSGTGKWLVREVQALDHDEGSDYAHRLHSALHEALSGDHSALMTMADGILLGAGGRLADGFELAAPLHH